MGFLVPLFLGVIAFLFYVGLLWFLLTILSGFLARLYAVVSLITSQIKSYVSY